VAPDVVRAGPPDLREGGGRRSSARSGYHHTLPKGQSMCPSALSDLSHMHSLRIRVGCDRYPAGRGILTFLGQHGEAPALRLEGSSLA
jgi:hypothetical protein